MKKELHWVSVIQWNKISIFFDQVGHGEDIFVMVWKNYLVGQLIKKVSILDILVMSVLSQRISMLASKTIDIELSSFQIIVLFL